MMLNVHRYQVDNNAFVRRRQKNKYFKEQGDMTNSRTDLRFFTPGMVSYHSEHTILYVTHKKNCYRSLEQAAASAAAAAHQRQLLLAAAASGSSSVYHTTHVVLCSYGGMNAGPFS